MNGRDEFNHLVLQQDLTQSTARSDLPEISTNLTSFKPYIIEEARLELMHFIDKEIKSGKVHTSKVINSVITKIERANGYFELKIPSGIILEEGPQLYVLNVGYVLYCHIAKTQSQNKDHTVYSFKVNPEFIQINKENFLINKPVKLYAAPPLLSLERMYQACSAEIPIDLNRHPVMSLQAHEIKIDELNEKQSEAVNVFLNTEQGVQLIWGPPGTGKTDVISYILQDSVRLAERTLVAAQTNVAVHNVASRFLKKAPPGDYVVLNSEGKHHPDLLKYDVIINSSEIRKQLFRHIQYLSHNGTVSDKDIAHELSVELNNKNNFILAGAQKEYLYMSDLFGAIQYACKPFNKPKYNIRKSINYFILRHQRNILSGADVVFSTLSLLGKGLFDASQSDDPAITFHALIVDEAGKALEPEAMIAMQRCTQKCLLVGDHEQLPPTTKLPSQKYQRSLFKRLIDQGRNPIMLERQYRMPQSIQDLVSSKIYNGKLECGIVPQALVIAEKLQPLSFFNIKYKSEEKVGESYKNESEASEVTRLVKYLVESKKIKPESIGIITFYQAQVEAINHRLGDRFKVKANTVDSYQGDERDIIILSFVRHNKEHEIGFLSESSRINVALTRAKSALIMFGHLETLMQRKNTLLAHALKTVVEKKCSYSEDDFQLIHSGKTKDSEAIPFKKLPLPNNRKRKNDLVSASVSHHSPVFFQFKDKLPMDEPYIHNFSDGMLQYMSPTDVGCISSLPQQFYYHVPMSNQMTSGEKDEIKKEVEKDVERAVKKGKYAEYPNEPEGEDRYWFSQRHG